MFELKDASKTDGPLSAMAEDHAMLASGLAYVGINPPAGTITIRLGNPRGSDFYLYMDLASAEDLMARLKDKIDWLREDGDRI
jgi:hypothetical protein